jgi:hypothetical protein
MLGAFLSVIAFLVAAAAPATRRPSRSRSERHRRPPAYGGHRYRAACARCARCRDRAVVPRTLDGLRRQARARQSRVLPRRWWPPRSRSWAIPLGSAVSDVGGAFRSPCTRIRSLSRPWCRRAGRARIVKALTRAYFAPVATEDGFREAVRDVVQEVADFSYDPETVVRDASFRRTVQCRSAAFSLARRAQGHRKQISLAEAKAFATRAFRSQNATLVVSGAVDPGNCLGAAGGRPDGEPAPEAPSDPEIASDLEPVTKNFVEDPSAATAGSGPASPIRAKRPRWTSSRTTFSAATTAT